MPFDKEMVVVELACQPLTGCGITIVGSRSSGIAIKSLLPGEVAHLDGRLKVGDKLMYVDGRQAGLMTCAQVAQYLRRQKRVQLQIYRPDYDLMQSSTYCHSNSKKSCISRTSRSYTCDAIVDLQSDLDCETRTVSTDLDISSMGPTPSPTTSCSDLPGYSPRASGRNTRTTKITRISSTSALTVPTDGDSYKPNFNFYYSGFDRLKRFMNILPKSSKDALDGMELSGASKYKSLFNSNSVSSEISLDADSCVDSDVFRVDSSEELICPGGM